MRVAVATSDFTKVAGHAGRARKWLVYAVDGSGVAGAPDEDWFMSRLAPFPMAAFTDPAPEGELVFPAKKHYVRCLENPNPMLVAMAERAKGLGFTMHQLKSGHCPQITVPVDAARLLAAIAENGAGAA